MANDGAPPREAFYIRLRPETTAIIAYVDGQTAGLFLLDGGRVSPEVHFCLLPHVWGKSEAIARAFLAWIWKQTTYEMLVGPVPAYNRLALKLATRVGFKHATTKRNAVLRHGKPYDLLYLTLERPVYA